MKLRKVNKELSDKLIDKDKLLKANKEEIQ